MLHVPGVWEDPLRSPTLGGVGRVAASSAGALRERSTMGEGPHSCKSLQLRV